MAMPRARQQPGTPPVSGGTSSTYNTKTPEFGSDYSSDSVFPAAFAEQNKLAFISQALQTEHQLDDDYNDCAGGGPSMEVHSSSGLPFIRVSRGRDFADAFSPDYFPKTFPTCFPYGRGGPKADRNESGDLADPLIRDIPLEAWTKVVLQRHGGQCAQHPAFSFLIFNMLVRSRNRWISQGRLKRPAFRRVAEIYRRLSPERLREAGKEMFETGMTTDSDVTEL